MPEISPERLRSTFDEAAELYERARPGYPAELFDDLAASAGLRPGARVLEIGAGTGKATLPLAERNYQVTAIELGPNLASVARRNLARFPKIAVIVAAFEDWPLPPEPFDAVVSATAFHWLDPSVRVTKAADALRPGGVLATIATHHIDGGDAQFFVHVQDCYRRWFQEPPPNPSPKRGGIPSRLPSAADIPRDVGELEQSGRFEPPTFRRYEWEQPYSAEEYIDLLSTYSDHRALEEAARRHLLDCISQLIAERYGGRIRKRYLNELRIARVS
ncbi:MAG: class I SAM-dependent methyltransferase [Candidatus Dormibacteraeota bacterium]|nr:class I SAM-dependent methyltransferase [Candidatus Dormibacteraeota bacterium]